MLLKSNQINFIVTSPQRMCLGEWNSWERAPDSAKTIYIYSTYLQTYTDDNVQNTHTYTQYTQCTIRHTYSYLYTLCTHNVYRCYRLYRRCYRLYISYVSWMCIRTTRFFIFVQSVHVVQLNCVKLKVLSILFYFYLLYNKKKLATCTALS